MQDHPWHNIFNRFRSIHVVHQPPESPELSERECMSRILSGPRELMLTVTPLRTGYAPSRGLSSKCTRVQSSKPFYYTPYYAVPPVPPSGHEAVVASSWWSSRTTYLGKTTAPLWGTSPSSNYLQFPYKCVEVECVRQRWGAWFLLCMKKCFPSRFCHFRVRLRSPSSLRPLNQARDSDNHGECSYHDVDFLFPPARIRTLFLLLYGAWECQALRPLDMAKQGYFRWGEIHSP